MSSGDGDPRDVPPRDFHWPRPRGRGALAELAIRVAKRLSGCDYQMVEYGSPSTYRPRYGWTKPPHEQLASSLTSRRDVFRRVLSLFLRYGEDLARISRQQHAQEPYWDQWWFTGVSAAVLYVFLRERDPAQMIEIGSGNSTLFAARAIRDGTLRTRLTSIDPEPRADVDAVCDEVIRAPFEATDPERFSSLDAGDVVLIDSSHYALMGSDVTAFFLDALPRIRPGVLVGVHDIFFPDDYPWWLAQRHYSEQYMLASTLVAGGDRYDVVMADHFVATDQELRPELDAAWARIGLADVLAYGSGFWFEPTAVSDSR